MLTYVRVPATRYRGDVSFDTGINETAFSQSHLHLKSFSIFAVFYCTKYFIFQLLHSLRVQNRVRLRDLFLGIYAIKTCYRLDLHTTC